MSPSRRDELTDYLASGSDVPFSVWVRERAFLESAQRPRREPDLVKATELPFWALVAWSVVAAVALFCVGVSLGVVILQWAGAW
jgi:hypothetical protein